MINLKKLKTASANWLTNTPFPHFIIDNFFEQKVAKKLETEFPNFKDNVWYEYKNAIEIKKTCNNWNVFPKQTYNVFSYLNSGGFVDYLSQCLFGNSKLFADPGLNGGGWHIHGKGGKLNTHLDYSLHPKLRLQRKLNIIIYLNSDWKHDWGGNLGMWNSQNKNKPGSLVKEIHPKFNRAIIFDTVNSWHGLPNPLHCPEGQFRKSLAVYYLTKPLVNINRRSKALFAPTKKQQNDKEVLQLIKKRSSLKTAAGVYSDKKK